MRSGKGHGIRVAPAADDAEMFRQATAAWEAGDCEAFVPRLKRALRSSSDYRLWHIHGLMLRRLGRRDEALPSLRRAVELNPNAAGPAHALARTLYESGLPSVDAFGGALQLSPGDPDIILDVASAFIAEGDVQAAFSGLERIVARSP
jgi:cytochrome c-type biogenesis protein CcmH/NrfG